MVFLRNRFFLVLVKGGRLSCYFGGGGFWWGFRGYWWLAFTYINFLFGIYFLLFYYYNFLLIYILNSFLIIFYLFVLALFFCCCLLLVCCFVLYLTRIRIKYFSFKFLTPGIPTQFITQAIPTTTQPYVYRSHRRMCVAEPRKPYHPAHLCTIHGGYYYHNIAL